MHACAYTRRYRIYRALRGASEKPSNEDATRDGLARYDKSNQKHQVFRRSDVLGVPGTSHERCAEVSIVNH
jgi:hypothetical protein